MRHWTISKKEFKKPEASLYIGKFTKTSTYNEACKITVQA